VFAALVREPWSAHLARLLGRPRLVKESARIEGAKGTAERYRLRFEPRSAGMPAPLPELEALVWVEADRFLVAVGRDADAPLAAALAARAGGESLAAIPEFARALAGVEPEADFAVVGNAAALASSGPAPVVASAMTTTAGLALRLDVSSRAVESLTRWGLLP
jgi:hypothetical protein